MEKKETFKLFFKDKTYIIPSNFDYLSKVSTDIYSSLTEHHQYEVKSSVNEKVFQSFIDYWVKKEIPPFCPDNINEYDILSQEFELMEDFIQIFRNITRRNNRLKAQNLQLLENYNAKNKEKATKIEKYKQIINYLFNRTKTSTFYDFLQNRSKLYEYCMSDYVFGVYSLTQEKIKEAEINILYSLNEEKKTAGVFNQTKKRDNIFIERTIQYNKQEYIVDRICEGAFSTTNSAHNVFFYDDSEVKIIGKRAFEKSQLNTILIPPKVEQIEEYCFSNTACLSKVEIHHDSCLKSIGKFAFFNSKIKTLCIPSSVAEFDTGWCKDTPCLVNIVIMKSKEQNIMYYDNKFILGKSDSKSEIFDTLIFARRDVEEAVIPSFIKYVSAYSFDRCSSLQKVEFMQNSELLEIGEFAFSNTRIKRLSISSCANLQAEWCNETPFLYDIMLIPGKNKNCNLFLNEKIVFGKSDSKSDIFDTIVFACRDIEEIVIPPFIKHILPCAFQNCIRLRKVEFAKNSQLETIGKFAFKNTRICHVSIPHSVYQIDFACFSYCSMLQSVEFSKRIDYLNIGNNMFEFSGLKSIVIPSSRIHFSDFWCISTHNLTDIKIIANDRENIKYYDDKFIIEKSNTKSDVFDVLVFARRDISEVTIPSFIKHIKPFALDNSKLQKLDFSDASEMRTIEQYTLTNTSVKNFTVPSFITQIDYISFANNQQVLFVNFAENSCLNLIGKYAFFKTRINSITIPSHVTKIDNCAFLFCSNLEKVQFLPNSELRIICSYAFSNTKISEITIPSSVTQIESFSFNSCIQLNKVYFEQNSKLTIIGDSSFASTAIKSIILPSHLSKIEKNAFFQCQNLESVEFENNSSLLAIGKYSFFLTKIVKIEIPRHVVVIDDFAFYCKNLEFIEFSEDSELLLIGKNAFAQTQIKSIRIPASVVKIDDDAFWESNNLEYIEFAEESHLQSIGNNAFCETNVREISLPSITKLKDKWLSSTHIYIANVIPMKEQNIISYNNEFILSKSDPTCTFYDTLVFASRQLYHAIIPPFIKKIASYAFANCCLLESIEFPGDSQLEEIDECAFYRSCVEIFTLPSHVKRIRTEAFERCDFISKLDLSHNYELKTIESSAFAFSSIEKLVLPSCVEKINGNFLHSCVEFKSIEVVDCNVKNIIFYKNQFIIGKSDVKSDVFDTLFYFNSKEKYITIPSFVKFISSSTFSNFFDIYSVDFETNTQIDRIDNFAFFITQIVVITIPSSVKKIGIHSFDNCKRLKKIKFEENSALQIIDIYAFASSGLESIVIPKKVNKICDNAFMSCKSMKIIEIDEDSELCMLNSNVFSEIQDVIVMIPSKLRKKLPLNT